MVRNPLCDSAWNGPLQHRAHGGRTVPEVGRAGGHQAIMALLGRRLNRYGQDSNCNNKTAVVKVPSRVLYEHIKMWQRAAKGATYVPSECLTWLHLAASPLSASFIWLRASQTLGHTCSSR